MPPFPSDGNDSFSSAKASCKSRKWTMNWNSISFSDFKVGELEFKPATSKVQYVREIESHGVKFYVYNGNFIGHLDVFLSENGVGSWSFTECQEGNDGIYIRNHFEALISNSFNESLLKKVGNAVYNYYQKKSADWKKVKFSLNDKGSMIPLDSSIDMQTGKP